MGLDVTEQGCWRRLEVIRGDASLSMAAQGCWRRTKVIHGKTTLFTPAQGYPARRKLSRAEQGYPGQDNLDLRRRWW
jgi:tellurite resistance-related uncharacterized protein